MKLNFSQDCSNSPKRELIKNICLAVVENDMDTVCAHLTDDIIWEFVEEIQLSGKEEIKVFFEKNRIGQVKEILLDYILTHGKLGSVGGKITLSTYSIYFADFYEFTSAKSTKIKKIKSFVLREKKG